MTLRKSFCLHVAADGTLDSQELTKDLESIAVEKLGDFHNFLRRASEGLETDIDWWVSSFSSRNCFTSPLFLNLLAVSLVVRLIDSGKRFSISTDSFFLFLIYKNVFKNRGASGARVKWTPAFGKTVKNLTRLCLVVGLSLPLFIFNTVTGRSYRGKLIVPKEIELFSCFATPDWWENDTERYFPGLTSYYSEDRLACVYFLPRVVGNKNWWGLRKANQQYRDGDKNVLILEDYVTVKDSFYSWSHLIRILLKRPKVLSWSGVDVRWLYFKECLSPSAILGSMKALLYYRFLKSLRNRGGSIRSFTNFFENQIIDKALHKGIREFFPAAKNFGYSGYSPVTIYYCSFPVQNEFDCGVLPDVLGLPGEGYRSYVDQFVNGLETVVVPHLRGSTIRDHMKLKKGATKFKVLMALPHTPSDWWYFVDLAFRINADYGDRADVLIKPHPIVNLSYLYDLMKKYDQSDHIKLVDGNILKLVADSSLLISVASGVLVESISLGVPVAVLRIPRKFMYNPIPPRIPGGLWMQCDDNDMVICYIERLLDEAREIDNYQEAISGNILDLFYEPISRQTLDRMLPSGVSHKN